MQFHMVVSGHSPYHRVKFHPDLIQIAYLRDEKHVKKALSLKVIPDVNFDPRSLKFLVNILQL